MAAQDDAIKAAEQRGYAKGYAAGKRRKEAGISAEQRQRRQDAFFLRAMVAAIPACIAAQGWSKGKEPITTLAQRMQLAADAADDAVLAAIKRGRLL